MTDSIATRVSRIIAGSAHALLDKAESLAPETLMAQSIREIEQVIDEVRTDLGKAEAGKHLVKIQIARLNSEFDELGAKVKFALGQGRDDLAEAAIARQTDIEDLMPVLQSTLHEHQTKANELESYVVALNAKQRELTQALRDFAASRQAEVGNLDGRQAARVADAERAFGDVLVRQGGVETSLNETRQDAGKLRELTEMQRQHRIAERLAAAKAEQAQ